VHGLHEYHLDLIPNVVEAIGHWAGGVPGLGAVTGWIARAAASAVVGLAVGAVVVAVLHMVPKKKSAADAAH